MEKPVINFSNFFEGKNSHRPDFNREDFKDFFLNESDEPEEILDEEDDIETPTLSDGLPVDDYGTPYFPEEEEILEPITDDDLPVDDYGTPYFPEEEEYEQKQLPNMESENYYPLFKDKSETFSCDVSVEGAKIDQTEVRLIIESSDWTLMFPGEVDRSGKCNIPIKKLGILNEGSVGKIRLEVIAEGTVFIPWEDDFKVKMSKKVSVRVNESRSPSKKIETKPTGVKVNVRR